MISYNHHYHDQVRVVGAGADERRANYFTCSSVKTGEARFLYSFIFFGDRNDDN